MKVYWKDIDDSKGQWCGMAVRVEQSPKPGFHLQVGGDRRIKLVTENKNIFWATVIKDYAGVWLVKSFCDLVLDDMPIPPIRSADIEERKNLQKDEWLKSWCRFFIEQLEQNSNTFLYDGLWLLGPCFVENKKEWAFRSSTHSRYMGTDVVYHVKEALENNNVELISWWLNGSGKLLNIKTSQADSGRVKWWRKKVREGQLPPILVWYLSCLDAYIIVDGHDRLMASILENQPPELIAISSAQEIQFPPDLDAQANIVESLNKQSDRRKSISVDHMNQVLIQAFDNSVFTQNKTFSWATISSDQIWVDEVAAFLRVIGQEDALTNIINRED